jgi:hypothetical protein
MTDPQRLLDDPSFAASLRADLAQAKAAGVAGFDVTAGAASLQAAIASETGAVATVSTTAGLSKGLIAAVVGVVSAGAIAWFVARGEPEPPPVEPVAAAAHQPEAEAKAEAALPAQIPAPPLVAKPAPAEKPVSAEVESAVEPDADPVESAAEPPTTAEPVKRKRAKAAPTEADYLREAKLIAEARRAMKTEPKRALKLLKEAKSEFPRGLLREEREALTILTLDALGRTEQARASAERFLKKHGQGPYADAVRQILR